MVVGSFASTVHGKPRTTQDLDLVIDPTTVTLDRFLGSLDLYIDAWVGAQGPRDATRGGGEFLGFAEEEGTGTSPMDRGETGTVDRRSTRSCVDSSADSRENLEVI